MRNIRLLTYTTLYPNAAQPQHGIFVEQRLRHLRAAGGIDARVVAPVPWFPWNHTRAGRYGRFAQAPRAEHRHGVDIVHPRYPTIPKVGMTLAPAMMALATMSTVRNVISEGYDFDLIDAHYFYPDGVSAALIASRLGKPFVVTARGTDINLIPRYRMARRMIQWTAARAAHIITVCQALKDALCDLGVVADRVTVLRNGVDLGLFQPQNRAEARRRLGLQRATLLSVGHLIARKGHDIVIRVLPELADVELLIVGQGEELSALRSLAASLGVTDRVRFVGAVAQEELRDYYSAADALVLASDREGWANVLLESMACGTPVIATAIWGTPEVVATDEAGVLMDERTPQALVRAYRRLVERYPDRTATRRYAERFSWDETVRGQQRVFEHVLGREHTAWAQPATQKISL